MRAGVALRRRFRCTLQRSAEHCDPQRRGRRSCRRRDASRPRSLSSCRRLVLGAGQPSSASPWSPAAGAPRTKSESGRRSRSFSFRRPQATGMQPALNLNDADWERHRAQLAWHQPFRDFEVQHLDRGRPRRLGRRSRGQPIFDERRRLQGLPRRRPRHHGAEARRSSSQSSSTRWRACSRRRAYAARAYAARCASSANSRAGTPGAASAPIRPTGEAQLQRRLVRARGRHRAAPARLARALGVGQAGLVDRPAARSGPARAPSARGARFATSPAGGVAGRTIAPAHLLRAHARASPTRASLDAAPAIGSLFGQFLQRKQRRGDRCARARRASAA